MKKKSIVLSLCLGVLFSTTIVEKSNATMMNGSIAMQQQYTNLDRVNYIGTNLVRKYGVANNVKFRVADEDHINAYANISDEIYVYKGLLNAVNNDEELAAVIAHELGHIINEHCERAVVVNYGLNVAKGIGKSYIKNEWLGLATDVAESSAVNKISRIDEFDADRTGVDILVKAGYNPLAMISVLNKICGNYFDMFSDHPSGEKRILSLYDYINYNYSSYLDIGYNTDSYQKALVMLEPLIKDRTDKDIEKIIKEQEKLAEQKAKRIEKARSTSDPWTKSYTTLKVITTIMAKEQ